ncbi:hypothetical protein [Stenotrophomonas maltophilia]|uniref:hypothetical protein n=1 Tax=Stenotrophomonas maltophilia TaxID=40324 RepID=UPI0021BDD136|nr:hypothetical protein [Stenotrophomonas maltophilia]
MAIALIALMLLELLLLLFWSPLLFRTGVVLSNQRIAASPTELTQLSLIGLEYDLPTDKWLGVDPRHAWMTSWDSRFSDCLHGTGNEPLQQSTAPDREPSETLWRRRHQRERRRKLGAPLYFLMAGPGSAERCSA